MANTVPTNVMSTMLRNSADKNVRYKLNCYIVHTVLLVIILLLIIANICCHYANHWSKQKGIDTVTM